MVSFLSSTASDMLDGRASNIPSSEPRGDRGTKMQKACQSLMKRNSEMRRLSVWALFFSPVGSDSLHVQ